MFSSSRRALTALLGAAALVLGVGVAQAAATVTVSVPKSATLLDRLVVPVALTVACGPYDFVPQSSGYGVTISQAQGRQVARGSANVFAGATGALECNGASRAYTLNVYPDPGSPPFHGGQAVIQANASVSFFDPSTFQFVTDAGSAGPGTISLSG